MRVLVALACLFGENAFASDTPVRFEFTFDIFRLSKGEEGKGVFVTFTFADGARTADELEGLIQRMSTDRSAEEARQKLARSRRRRFASCTRSMRRPAVNRSDGSPSATWAR